MALYQIYNGASPTTAALAPVTTGTAIKTLLQIKLGTQNKAKVKEWGISFDGSAAATPIKCELIETDVAATVTAHTASGIVLLGDPNDIDPTTSNIILTTTGTGFTASAEGTTTASRLFDYQLVAPTNQYIKQFPLGVEPMVNVSKFLRVRVTAPVAVNALCYVTLEI
jgi:hypothetical protein